VLAIVTFVYDDDINQMLNAEVQAEEFIIAARKRSLMRSLIWSPQCSARQFLQLKNNIASVGRKLRPGPLPAKISGSASGLYSSFDEIAGFTKCNCSLVPSANRSCKAEEQMADHILASCPYTILQKGD